MNECFRSAAIWIYKIKWWRGLNLLLSNANAGYVYCKELRWNKIKANKSLFSHDLSVAHLRTENKFRYWLELTTACYQGDQIKLCTTVDPFIFSWGTEKNCKWHLFSCWLARGSRRNKGQKPHKLKGVSSNSHITRGLFVLHPQYLPLLGIYSLIQIPLESLGSA